MSGVDVLSRIVGFMEASGFCLIPVPLIANGYTTMADRIQGRTEFVFDSLVGVSKHVPRHHSCGEFSVLDCM